MAIPRSFAYSRSLVALSAAVSCFAYVFPVYIALLIALVDNGWSEVGEPIGAAATFPPLAIGWALFSGAATWQMFVHRPVWLTGEGAESKLFGRPLRSIGWAGMPSVTKTIIFESEGWGLVEAIEIFDGKQKIRAKSDIDDYLVPKAVLNAVVAEHKLPVVVVDLSGTKRIVHDEPSTRL